MSNPILNAEQFREGVSSFGPGSGEQPEPFDEMTGPYGSPVVPELKITDFHGVVYEGRGDGPHAFGFGSNVDRRGQPSHRADTAPRAGARTRSR